MDMGRQAVMLTMALQTIVQHYDKKYPITGEYLSDLGARHHEWGIPRELYANWHDAYGK